MVKQLSIHKGFTLIETMVVLSILCIMMIIYPIPSYESGIHKNQDLMLLYEFLLQAQHEAMYKHQRNEIQLYGNTASSRYQTITLTNLNMNHYLFHFNAKGHISKALTITFTNSNRKIVAQLGSGSFDLR